MSDATYPSAPVALHLRSAGATDPGMRRQNNEDALVLDAEKGVFVVADGIGGHRAGEVASSVASAFVRDAVAKERAQIDQLLADPSAEQRAQAAAILERVIQAACAHVHRLGTTEEGKRGMGTTLDAVVCSGHRVLVGHVGDGRVYLVRSGAVHRLTEDHTLVAMQVKAGVITEEQAAGSALRSILTRNVGSQPSVQVDTLCVDLVHGDVLLLCTDGLHRYLSDNQLHEKLAAMPASALPAALIAHANSSGGSDNITAIVLVAESAANDAASTLAGRRMDAVRAVSLLQHLSYKEQVEVLSIAQSRSFPKGTNIFREGQAGTELFVVVSGRVVVEKDRVSFAEMGPGGHFGEMALVDYAPRSATVRALEDTETLVISQSAMGGLMRVDPVVGVKVLWRLVQELSSRLRQSNEEVIDWRLGNQPHTVREPFSQK